MNNEHAVTAWNRYVDLGKLNSRKNEKYKVDLQRAFRFVGASQFRIGELPMPMKRKIKQNILRGYSLTRHGNVNAWMEAVLRACPVEEVYVGYVCRQHMKLYVNIPDKERNKFTDSLQALCGVTGKVQSHFMQFGTEAPGWVRCKASGQWTNTSDGPRFEEVKLFADTELRKTLAKRQRVVAWFESDPTVTITFKG